MNLYLLNLVGKWIGVLIITVTSFFGGYTEKEIAATNTNKNMSLNLVTEVIKYQTEVRYNNQKPNGEKLIVVKGEDGYLVRNHDNNSEKVIKEAVTEIVEVGTYIEPVAPVASTIGGESFIGRLTVYYNCPGKVTCKTSSGYNLKENIYYNDPTYGPIRVLSAAKSKFSFGTIVEVSGTPLGTFYGIVLDRGGSMESAWNKGSVWIDLAIDPKTEPAMASYSSSRISYNVKRWGF